MNLVINNTQRSLLIKTTGIVSVNLHLLAEDLVKHLFGKEILYYSTDINDVSISTTLKLMTSGCIACDSVNFTLGEDCNFEVVDYIADNDFRILLETKLFESMAKSSY